MRQDRLARQLASTIRDCPESVVIFADELPVDFDTDLTSILRIHFGAEANDRVIDLRNGQPEPANASWIISFPGRMPLRKVC